MVYHIEFMNDSKELLGKTVKESKIGTMNIPKKQNTKHNKSGL